MMGKSESTISVWAPMQERFHEISLDKTHLYREISRERFESIREDYRKGLISKIEKDQFKDLNAEKLTIKKNKDNLSA